MSCDSKDVVTEGETSACLEDDPQRSAGVPEAICSAILNGDKGVTIKILANNDTRAEPEEVLLGEFEAPGGVVVGSGITSAEPALTSRD